MQEIFVGILWAASGVQVFGYTWNAYKNTYSQFPGMSGGFGSEKAIGLNTEAEGKKIADNLISKIPVVGPPLVAAQNWLQNLFSGSGFGQGPSSLSAKDISRLQQLPAPPRPMVVAVQRGNAAHNVAPAANALGKWALANGWKNQDVINFLKYIGVAYLGP